MLAHPVIEWCWRTLGFQLVLAHLGCSDNPYGGQDCARPAIASFFQKSLAQDLSPSNCSHDLLKTRPDCALLRPCWKSRDEGEGLFPTE